MYFDHDVRFSWRWTILLHKKYYFCNPSIFCILVLKYIVLGFLILRSLRFVTSGLPSGMCLVPFSDRSHFIELIQRM